MEGSSSISSLGLLISARPMASICCSPPDSVPATCFSRSFSLGKRWNTSSSEAGISSLGREKPPISRFSRTVICWNTRRPSGHSAMPFPTMRFAPMPTMLSPLKEIMPMRGFNSPDTVFSVVDLPAPLAPISVTISPSLTSKDMPLMACMEP